MSSISVEWINPFIEATIEIMKSVAMIEPKMGKPRVKSEAKSGYDISGIIGLTGEATGSIALSLPKKTALSIVSNFMGQEVLGLDADTADAIGEITNMIAGKAKKIFSEKGIKMKISIPNVVIGKEHTINPQKSIPTIEIPFSSEVGDFAIQVSLKKS